MKMISLLRKKEGNDDARGGRNDVVLVDCLSYKEGGLGKLHLPREWDLHLP